MKNKDLINILRTIDGVKFEIRNEIHDDITCKEHRVFLECWIINYYDAKNTIPPDIVELHCWINCFDKADRCKYFAQSIDVDDFYTKEQWEMITSKLMYKNVIQANILEPRNHDSAKLETDLILLR